MMSFVIHRTGGNRPGEIVQTGYVNAVDIALQVPDPSTGLAMVTGEIIGPAHQYVTDMGVADRPTMLLSIDKTAIVANGEDAATISRMPEGAKVIVNGQSFNPVDGAVLLTSKVTRTFEVLVTCWPCVDFSIKIEAT